MDLVNIQCNVLDLIPAALGRFEMSEFCNSNGYTVSWHTTACRKSSGHHWRMPDYTAINMRQLDVEVSTPAKDSQTCQFNEQEYVMDQL